MTSFANHGNSDSVRLAPRPGSYRIHTRQLGPMDNFIYLIEDVESSRGAVVDPAWDVPAILDLATAQGIQITDILLTHSHHDHINGVAGILDATDAQVHLLKAEADFYGHNLPQPALHHGGDILRLGKTPIEFLHTPGHTPGSACYRVEDDLIVGDTLFVFGCGRCDLPGGDPKQMYDSLRKLRENLPWYLRLLPGHDYGVKPTSTLQEQAECNPFMRIHDLGRFIRYRMHDHDQVRHPPYAPECD